MKLTDYAMLATLKISKWGGEKKDQSITQEIAQSKDANARLVSGHKKLIEAPSFARISTVAGKARNHVHYVYTMPWADNGARILPVELYSRYMQEMALVQDEFDSAVDDFIAEYPTLIKAAELKQSGLGTAFNLSDYPSPQALRNHFRLEAKIRPIPEGRDFRVSMTDEVIKGIQQDLDAEVTEAFMGATRSVYRRIAEVVTSMCEGLERHGQKAPGAKKAKGFKDASIENVIKLVEILPDLNVAGDPVLSKLANDMANKLTRYTAEDYREDEALREQTIKDAKAILSEVDEGAQGIVDFFGISNNRSAA